MVVTYVWNGGTGMNEGRGKKDGVALDTTFSLVARNR